MLTQKQRQQLSNYFNNNDFKDKDALAIYPFRYEMLQALPTSQWIIGDDIITKATIVSPISVYRKSYKQAYVSFDVLIDRSYFKVRSFNPYIQKSLEGQEVVVIGRYHKPNEILASSVNTKPIESQIGIFPVYSLHKDVKQFQIRAIMKKIVKENIDDVEDIIPLYYREKYRLLSEKESIKQLHLPQSKAKLDYALRTLKYKELLEYQVALQLQKQSLQKLNKPSRVISNKELDAFLEQLPFELTIDQLKVFDDLRQDMKSQTTMTRLLQGDVGSGKTIIAVLASLIAINSGYQVAILCPTEVLMNQHFETFQNFLKDKATITTYSFSLKVSEKKAILNQISEGSLQIVIGTHSLFSENIVYNNLGLAIIDEQHRFGVNQRQALLKKGEWVDALMMSATPIPRTLASALYAHLDVSTIETMPSSRKKVETRLVNNNSMMPIMDEILMRIKNGDQCYVVCPAIDDSNINMRNVNAIYLSLKDAYQDKIRIEMIHGQMSSEDMNLILVRFKNREIDCLITTTVIEVGLHVPTANTMVIYDADRFGLAQLHQLRGRLGRSGKPGLCYLLTNTKDSNSLERLEYLNQNDDGFQLAYYDLKMRGSGDLLGQRQSGIPHFLLSDILKDDNILQQAKIDAQSIINSSNEQDIVFTNLILERINDILMQGAI